MKNSILSLIVILAIGFTSCTKQEITPGNYPPNKAPSSTTNNWQGQYTDGGTINTGIGANNDLVGTTWVLTEYRVNYSTKYPKDTIRFIDNTHYTIQNGVQRTYSLASGVASTNKSLSFNLFYPFGGSNYSGQVGGTFVSDGVINNAEFKDLQNSSVKIIAFFKKI